MASTFPPYSQWKQDNHFELAEKGYRKFGTQIQEYADFFEAEYDKAKKSFERGNQAPSP